MSDYNIGYSNRANLEGNKIDIILETPGGFAEVVEDIDESIRGRFSEDALLEGLDKIKEEVQEEEKLPSQSGSLRRMILP